MNLKKTIGRIDKVDFPELNLSEIDIKIDTGAYTSSIHCGEIREVEIEGEQFIRFILLDPSHPQYNEKEIVFKNYNERTVKSSNGATEDRYSIWTTIELFNETYPIELTLSERGEMKFPVLIGRKFLNKKFVVDPSKKNISFKVKSI